MNGTTYPGSTEVTVRPGYWTYKVPPSGLLPEPNGREDLRYLIQNWLDGKSYLDLNFAVGYGGGGTIGIMFNGQGVHLYYGAGFVTPGARVALTWSPNQITPGWGCAAQITAVGSAQFGYAKGLYGEIGFGIGAGLTVAPYYVLDGSLW